MKTILGFDGHIILYCKRHYDLRVNTITALRRIWAVRCGLSIEYATKFMDTSILNYLYEILITIDPTTDVSERIHSKLAHDGSITTSELISIYVSALMTTEVKNKVNGEWITLINLPTPNPNVMNKIINGRGRPEHYDVIANNQ
jgi:hypothetical protein